jgi:hypothetical protein
LTLGRRARSFSFTPGAPDTSKNHELADDPRAPSKDQHGSAVSAEGCGTNRETDRLIR